MVTVEAQLAQLHHLQKFDGDTVNHVLGLLDRNPVGSFSVEARCQMLGLLKGCILTSETIRYNWATYAATIPDLDTRHGNTLSHIFNLQAGTQFSKRLEHWMDRNMGVFLDRIKNDPAVRTPLQRDWAAMSVPERLAILNDIKEHYIEAYRLKPFRLAMMLYELSPLYGEAFGGLKEPRHRADVRINPRILKYPEPDLALEVLHHENTHIAIGQLARAWNRRQIDPGHAIAADAELAYYRALYGSYCPASMSQAYNNDPEEKVAFNEGRKFAYALR